MKRLLSAAALATVAVLSATPASAEAVSPGGQCDGVVDFFCREHVCQPDELDCGLIPPCFVWTLATGCLL